MKNPRGILNYGVTGHNMTDITWKMTGNLGGEDFMDRTRGPLNEGVSVSQQYKPRAREALSRLPDRDATGVVFRPRILRDFSPEIRAFRPPVPAFNLHLEHHISTFEILY